MYIPIQQFKNRQSGAALITGLIFMVVLTIIVISALRSATLEERMAANARNRQLALQAAEAMLREVEATVINATPGPTNPFDPFFAGNFTDGCNNGLCRKAADGSTPKWKTVDWSDTAKTRTFANPDHNSGSGIKGVASQPRYIIEIVGYPSSTGPDCTVPALYRITSRGVGMDNSEVFVQTMYRHLPNDC